MQRFDQRLHFLTQHAGHQPLAAFLVDLVEYKQRHGHGQAIARITGLVQVGRGAVHATQSDGFGERRGRNTCRLMAH